MLTVSQTHFSEIKAHAKACYPEECCGALLGHFQDGKKRVVKTDPIDNTSPENRRRRFVITPDEYRRVDALAKASGLELLGFYHSHPDHPAKPSQTDLTYAWPVFSYIILSIEKNVPKTMRSFILDLDTNEFTDEDMQIEGTEE